MQDVYIIDALRTPFGSFGGQLADISAHSLAAQVMKSLLERHPIPETVVDEVIIGQVLQGGSAQAPARQAMREAGLPDSVHAMTINKVCGSGLKSVMMAADSIRLGNSSVVIAGGMENMSLAPYIAPATRFGQRMGHSELRDMLLYDGLLDPYSGKHMGEITEDWVVDKEISRAEQDEYAAHSYRLAQAAVENGTFADELVPVIKKTRKGVVAITKDEEPFRGNIEKLPELRAAFRKDGRITAGNASTINDGAAMLFLADLEVVNRYDLKPIARLIASATHSIAPELFAEAPVDAIRKCVAKAGLELEEIDLFEINEAFAAVPLLAMRELKIPLKKVNVHGGAVAIGHPIGASGARLAATLLREMRIRQVRYGVASLCIGGGEAVAVLFERI